jgi:hypothetical protein
MASPVLLGNEEQQICQDTKAKKQETLEIANRLTYAVELACDETDTRHWRHPWCMDENSGELALRPPILPKDTATTIPNCFNLAAQKFGEAKCIGSRPILECTLDGTKQYWTKGDYTWKSYTEVHAEVTAAAKGLLSLPSVMGKRVVGAECVAAILAETSSEWQVSAQAALQCGITLTTIYTTLWQGSDAAWSERDGGDGLVHRLDAVPCTEGCGDLEVPLT